MSGDEEVGAGERGGAQDRAHLGAEPAAGDQHQAFDHLRELVGELHRDAAAERVTDHGGALVAERQQQVAQAAGQRADRVVAATGLGGTVAGKIGGDHGVVAGQRLDHLAPVLACAGDAVDQQQHRPLAGLHVGDRAAVDGGGLNPHLGHADKQ